MSVSFSYSGIKTFEQCPKKYFHTRVAKDVVDDAGEAALYGTAVHKVAEDFTNEGKPVPKKFEYMAPVMGALSALKGDHYAEIKLGLRKTADGYEACDFDDPDYWWHGIADLVVINGIKGVCVDYKTGKNFRYADIRQLDLLAGAMFAHYPDLMQIKGALLYVNTNDVADKLYVRTEMSRYLSVFDRQLARLETAHENGVWNPKSSGLCPWCPVQTCEHWTPRTKWQ